MIILDSFYWGLHHPTERLQRSYGQLQRDLEGCDWEERTARSVPQLCLVIGNLC